MSDTLGLDLTERLPHESASKYALRILYQNIISLRLKPGQPLKEAELTALLHISRTPIREALVQLSNAYLVEIIPQRETRVALIDPSIIEEARALRLLVEPLMAEKACSMATPWHILKLKESMLRQQFYLEQSDTAQLLKEDNTFHRFIYEICGAKRTYEAINSISGQYDIVRAACLYYFTAELTVRNHTDIAEAIAARDPGAAHQAAANHIMHHTEDQNRVRSSFPEYFK